MFDSQQRRWAVPLVLAVLVLLIDQVSKRWIRGWLGPDPMQQRVSLLGDWLNIVYSRNTGVAFGLFQNMSPIFIVVSLLICAGAIYVYSVYLPNENLLVQVPLGLILGGALGNVIDRIYLGYVVDFIQVGWWPIFNVADSAITTGAVVLAFFLLFLPEEPPRAPNPQDEALLDELLSHDVALDHDQQQNLHS